MMLSATAMGSRPQGKEQAQADAKSSPETAGPLTIQVSGSEPLDISQFAAILRSRDQRIH
jgi:hypothetical protein